MTGVGAARRTGTGPVAAVTSAPTTDQVAIRRAFGALPSAVAAFAAVVDGSPLVMIASSFTVGVSYDPPMVSVAVQRSSTTWPVLGTAEVLGVSVLGEAHATKTRQLASRDRHRRLADVPHVTTSSGAVLLDDAAARFECRVEHVYPAGDHDIVVLRVLAMHEGAAEALVWRAT